MMVPTYPRLNFQSLACVSIMLFGGTGQQLVQRSDTVVKVADKARHPGAGTLVAELTIRIPRSAPESLLGSVKHILPARDGSVWILEGDAMLPVVTKVRRYDSAGRFIRNVGHRGDGPGGFINPAGIAQLSDERVVVWDPVPRRLHMYFANGEPLADLDLASIGPLGNMGNALVVDLADNIYLPVMDRTSATATVDSAPRAAFVRVSPHGVAIDTVFRPQLPDMSLPTVTVRGTTPTGLRWTTVLSPAFSPFSLAAWSPLGYWITGVADRYSFELRVPRSGKPEDIWRIGDTVLSIRRTGPLVDVSIAERADRDRYMTERIIREGGDSTLVATPTPATKPAYRWLMVSEEGRIWVQVSVPSERYEPAPQTRVPPYPVLRWREPVAYDIYEPGGDYLGRVAVPGNVTRLTTRGDIVWGVVTSDDGEKAVTRFRISWRD